jgi:hypothetical protein
MLSSTSVRDSLVDLHLQSETYNTKTNPASFSVCIRCPSVFSHLVHIPLLVDIDTVELFRGIISRKDMPVSLLQI